MMSEGILFVSPPLAGRPEKAVLRKAVIHFRRLPLRPDWFRAGIFHADAVERCSGRNVQSLVIISAEGDVGGAFGNGDAFQQLTVGVENVDSAVRGVKIASRIDRHAIAAFVDRE